MTPEQITNWRKVLVGILGPYAVIMPDEQVVALRDKLQLQVYAKESKKTSSFFNVDYHLTSSIGLTKTDDIEVQADDKEQAEKVALSTLRKEYPNSSVVVLSIEAKDKEVAE